MIDQVIHRVVEQLSTMESYRAVYHPARKGVLMPSIDVLQDVVSFLRRIFFPGYFAHSEVTADTMHYYIGANVDKVHRLLSEQVHRGFCFPCGRDDEPTCSTCPKDALETEEITVQFISKLPDIRKLLATDAQAADRKSVV